MSNIVKSKFAGLLRGLLRCFDDSGATTVTPPRPMAAVTFSRATSPADAPQTKFQPAFAPRSATPDASDIGLQLPLPSIIAVLPIDLRAKMLQMPQTDAFVSIPVEKALSQLAHGAVKISFGELRAARPGLFGNSRENDARQIALPLNEIISRISPALLSRRAAKKVDVSDDIAGPFGARAPGAGFTPAQAPVKTTPKPPSKAPELVSAPVAPMTGTPPPAVGTTTLATAPRPAAIAPTPAAPAIIVPTAPVKPVFSASPPVPAAPIPHSTPFSSPPAESAANGFHSAPKIPFSAPQISGENPILAPLSALVEKWPDAIKAELVQTDLISAQAALPAALIEPGLKRGRVTIQWKNLRLMLRPKPAPVSVHDGVELELPLKVLAPLFFASQKAARLAKQKVSVSAEIPNLFKNAEAAISPAPASAPATVPAPAPTAPAELAETNHFPRPEAPASGVFQRQASPGTDFLSRGVTPREAVARALKLPGVTGAVVALYDGLLIAGQLPEDLNADTVAAILPQIFARTGESVTELRMGELNNLSFTAGDVPWKIFRVNAVYFAVLGRAGEALPAEPLMALAGQLDRKNK